MPHSAHNDIQIVCRCHELVEGTAFSVARCIVFRRGLFPAMPCFVATTSLGHDSMFPLVVLLVLSLSKWNHAISSVAILECDLCLLYW